MSNLRVNGWGPFAIPGEKARLKRLEKRVQDFVAVSTNRAAEERRAGSSVQRRTERNPVSQFPSSDKESRAKLSVSKWQQQLGERKIFFEGQEGADVEQLQHRLVNFGFLSRASISGQFDDATKNALRDFQHKFGIYVDGVAGSVTAKVLRFLSTIDYRPDQIPVPDDVLVLIQRVARSQRLGIALIGRVARGLNAELSEIRLDVIDSVSHELVALLNDHPILQGAELPEGYTPERATQLADSIDAELVIYLDILNSPSAGPGIATHFFSAGTSDSAIGAPLATCIHDELIRVTGVRDRGCSGEDSHLLQQPNAPTVRVELGNINDQSDRVRLENQAHQRQLATAIMLGISRLYELELPRTAAQYYEDTTNSLNKDDFT